MGIRAVRLAARVRRELQTYVDVVHGRYGEFKVTVDGDTVIDVGAAAFLGVMPSRAEDRGGGQEVDAGGSAAMMPEEGWTRRGSRRF